MKGNPYRKLNYHLLSAHGPTEQHKDDPLSSEMMAGDGANELGEQQQPTAAEEKPSSPPPDTTPPIPAAAPDAVTPKLQEMEEELELSPEATASYIDKFAELVKRSEALKTASFRNEAPEKTAKRKVSDDVVVRPKKAKQNKKKTSAGTQFLTFDD